MGTTVLAVRMPEIEGLIKFGSSSHVYAAKSNQKFFEMTVRRIFLPY